MGTIVAWGGYRWAALAVLTSGLSGALAAMVVAEAARELRDPGIVTSPLAGEFGGETTRSGTEEHAARDAFAEIWNRPLFSPTRRPREPDVPDAGGPKPPRIQLVAVVEFRGARQACVKLLGKEKIKWLSEGDQLEQWRLSSIGTDRVYFRRGDDVVKMMLIQSRNP